MKIRKRIPISMKPKNMFCWHVFVLRRPPVSCGETSPVRHPPTSFEGTLGLKIMQKTKRVYLSRKGGNLKMKENKDEFFAEKIIFTPSGEGIGKEEIDEIDNFPGKDDFISFYVAHNGVEFPYGAWFIPEDCYKVSGDYEYITLDFFFNIPKENDVPDPLDANMESIKDSVLMKYGDFEDFVLFHIPFAMDVASNIFWIDIQSGEIKYTDFRESINPEDVITVAFSFKDFCKRITSNKDFADADIAFLNKLSN